MSAERQLNLAATAGGRVMLHLLALNADWKLRWHMTGILRELHFSLFLRAQEATPPEST
jgi:hypothetical protein